MKRRNFIGLLAGTIAAFTFRAAKMVDAGILSKLDLGKHGETFETLEINGIPVYLDPYAPEGTIYYFPDKITITTETWVMLAQDFLGTVNNLRA
jgi:hypothetical protein